MSFPSNTVLQAQVYSYYNPSSPHNYQLNFWFSAGGGWVTDRLLKLSSPLTLAEINDINTNGSTSSSYISVLARLNSLLSNNTVSHTTSFSNNEQIFINSVTSFSVPTGSYISTGTNVNGGYFPMTITLNVNRGYNSTSIQADTSSYSAATVYSLPISQIYNNYITDGFKLDLIQSNTLNFYKTLLSQIKITESINNNIHYINYITSTLKLTSTSIYQNSLLQIINDGLGLTVTTQNKVNFKNLILQVFKYNQSYGLVNAGSFLIMIHELFILKEINYKEKVFFNSIINDIIHIFNGANCYDYIKVFRFVNDIIKIGSTNNILLNTQKIYEILINELFVFYNNNTNLNANYINKVADYFKINNISNIIFNSIIILSDKINFNNIIINNLNIKEVIKEIISTSMLLTLNNEEYECYSVNIENKALTRYQNFNFNSYCQLQNQYYGMQKTGLCNLVNKDGTGEILETIVKTSFLNIANIDDKTNNLGTLKDKEKYLKNGYLIVKNNGQVNLRIYTDKDESFDYILNQDYNNEKFRVDFGKGVRGGLFQLEISSIGDFELKECEIIPVILKRRV